ncbi:inner membrane metabolite transport protein YgcS [Arthrobacter sp. Hiyo1]|nr:inner membrane metabolite transport protein YgcS [Arthrobacter sp. Hiyo1]
MKAPTGTAAPALTATQQIDSRPLTGHQKSLIGLVVLGNISEFFDMFLIGFVVSLLTVPWHLTGLEAGVILACSGLGTVLGAIMWGRLADKIGRRKAFFWCVVLFTFFTFLSLFTPDRGWWVLAILRVAVGIGVGGLNISSIPYVQELVPSKRRGLLAGLASVFIPLGLLLGARHSNGWETSSAGVVSSPSGSSRSSFSCGCGASLSRRGSCSSRAAPRKPAMHSRGRWISPPPRSDSCRT